MALEEDAKLVLLGVLPKLLSVGMFCMCLHLRLLLPLSVLLAGSALL